MIKAIFYFWSWDYLISARLINSKLYLLSVFQSILLETQQHWQLVISHGQKSGHQASNMHTTLNWTIFSSYCFSSRTQIIVLSQHRSYRCGRYNGSITTAAASTDSLSLTKIHLIVTYKMLCVLKLLRHFVMLKVIFQGIFPNHIRWHLTNCIYTRNEVFKSSRDHRPESPDLGAAIKT